MKRCEFNDIQYNYFNLELEKDCIYSSEYRYSHIQPIFKYDGNEKRRKNVLFLSFVRDVGSWVLSAYKHVLKHENSTLTLNEMLETNYFYFTNDGFFNKYLKKDLFNYEFLIGDNYVLSKVLYIFCEHNIIECFVDPFVRRHKSKSDVTISKETLTNVLDTYYQGDISLHNHMKEKLFFNSDGKLKRVNMDSLIVKNSTKEFPKLRQNYHKDKCVDAWGRWKIEEKKHNCARLMPKA
eukprot:CAMPEP_0167752580 /NCGR_PEP_ID=MMETSP0110_2-20121227/7220_1 /TAXON_ID=629695 /ORGANISM="Gymnochlora sp., Strain CCMP2014" /LENGTH=236 /DNA_ID=CAMNT_0007638217 /DNA_START=638 /DNA_END=1348 /DNA_ORIENTATION=-